MPKWMRDKKGNKVQVGDHVDVYDKGLVGLMEPSPGEVIDLKDAANRRTLAIIAANNGAVVWRPSNLIRLRGSG